MARRGRHRMEVCHPPSHPPSTLRANPCWARHANDHRATVLNARVTRGHTVLLTGIGGGVALTVLQLCLALGAHVYVTSGSDAKIASAVALGAAGGVNYTHGQSAHLFFFYFSLTVRRPGFSFFSHVS